jgi:DNA-binding beta-propeller fold protein YncE
MLKKLLFLLVTGILAGCLGNRETAPIIKESSSIPDGIIVNSLSESLSIIYKGNPKIIENNIKDDSGHFLNTGSAPNQILEKDGLVFILNSMSNNLQIIDPEKRIVKTELSLGSGKNPYFMAFYGDDKLYVTNLIGEDGNGDVSVIKKDLSGNYAMVGTIPLPHNPELEPFSSLETYAKPQGIAVSNSKIYVTLTNLAGWSPGGPGFVVVIDPSTDQIINKIKTSGLNPSCAYVSKFEPDKIFVLHSGTFSGDGLVDLIDTSTDTITGTINTGGAPYSMTLNEDGMGFVTDALGPHLFRFNSKTLELLNGSNDPILVVDPLKADFNFLSFIAINKEGYLYTLAFNSDELYILDPSNAQLVEGPYLVGDGPISMIVD